jgi:F0F1-type ATP synthase epsilon subunit
MSSLDSESPLTVGDFIERYNEDIEYCVVASNYGFAAEIDQAESALEKHEAQQHLLAESGVAELKKLDKEHDNVINRFLALIH